MNTDDGESDCVSLTKKRLLLERDVGLGVATLFHNFESFTPVLKDLSKGPCGWRIEFAVSNLAITVGHTSTDSNESIPHFAAFEFCLIARISPGSRFGLSTLMLKLSPSLTGR